MEADRSQTPSEPPAVDRESVLAAVRTVVVKVGTNVLTRRNGEMSLGKIHGLVENLADLKREGKKVILVSSGAVCMGMHRLGLDRMPVYLRDKQACASVGQIRLMAVYQQAFNTYGIPAGQILLTEDDFSSRKRYLNLRNTIHRLLEFGVLPIINENDSTSTSEIEEAEPEASDRTVVFGDNDVLSALVTSKLGADLLILLSNIEGLYPDGPPDPVAGPRAGSAPLSVVSEVTPRIEAMAGAKGPLGRGGMASKLLAARIATRSGSFAVIASGNRPDTIPDILAGKDVGTLFLPSRRLASRKRWIAFASSIAGRICVNEGARSAICDRRSSLLFAGVSRLDGEFHRGDVVSIVDDRGGEFARGITNYDASEARPLIGKRSEEIFRIVGRNFEELINRDNLVVR